MAFWNRWRGKGEIPPEKGADVAARERKIPGHRPPVPLEVKLLAVEALTAGLSSVEVAELVGVCGQTISNWQKQYLEGGVQSLSRKPASPRVRKQCAVLAERIVARRRENPEHGVRRIRDELRREEGIEVSAETVREVVNEAGLGNPPPEAKRRPPQIRRYERECPNAMWQIDIFTFTLKRLFPVYLVGVIDDHSRFIAGWGLFRQQTGDAVLEVVKGAVGQWGAPREILSDNGRQFVAWRGESRFQRVLKQQGIQHVRSAPQHPMTLGKIERFWQSIWKEFLWEATFASFPDACQRIGHWINYYNHQRPHQGLDGACPADRFYGIAGDIEEAVRQGCKDNSLRLAMDQEPQAPLFLLGQLGGTDVRVTRKGEDIEIKVGDTVHEVIRLGAPFTIGEDGVGKREGATNEVAGLERHGALPGDRPGPQGDEVPDGDLRELRDEQTDALPGDGGDGQGGHRGAGAQDGGAQATVGAGVAVAGGVGGEAGPDQGSRAVEDEVRDRGGLPGTGAQVGAGRAAAGTARKKTSIWETQTTTNSCALGQLFLRWAENDDGADD